jgi:hypothetical protein
MAAFYWENMAGAEYTTRHNGLRIAMPAEAPWRIDRQSTEDITETTDGCSPDFMLARKAQSSANRQMKSQNRQITEVRPSDDSVPNVATGGLAVRG